MLQTVIYSYLVVINVVAFAIYGLDKKRAIHDEWRIPEATLLALAAVGGSVGALFGMQTFHHKTRKPRFWVVNILGLLWQIALCVYLLLNK